jgi:hypothetical protein
MSQFDLTNLIQKQSRDMERADVISTSSSAGPAVKRVRLEGVDLFQLIAKNLHDMRHAVKSKPISSDPSKIEIEMRVGMIIDGSRRWKSHKPTGGGVIPDERVNFKSGIDEILAERIKSILKATGFRSVVEPPQRVRIDHTGSLRCTVDSHGQEIGYLETKDKFLRCNIACLAHNYDMRIDVASEIETDVTSRRSTDPRPVWNKERLKKRIKYRREQTSTQRSYWMVDLTEVTTTDLMGANIGKSITTIELEYEMLPEVLAEWLHYPDEECVRFTSELASELLKFFDLCIPSHGNSSFESNEEMMTRPLQQTAQLFTAVTSLLNRIRGSTHGSEFIGSMPLNISRRNLKTLQQWKYFITEKSDGIRYLMTIIPSAAVVTPTSLSSSISSSATAILMDRAPTFKLPLGANEIGRHLGLGTVLDGELVYNMTSKREVFLIFDVLAIDGEICAHEPFEKRLQLLKDRIEPRLQSMLAAAATINTASPPGGPSGTVTGIPMMNLVRKLFWLKTDFKVLLSLIKHENGERIFKESYWRYHKTDGLIFQPNLPYTFGTDNNLIKWKWSELTSVDLTAILYRKNQNQRTEIEIGLLCGGPDGSQIDVAKRGTNRLSFHEFDAYRIIADLEDSNRLINIAEVAYNPSHGVWVYFHLREDKTQPNYVNTVLGVLMEQAEAISIDELEYRLLARNESENDYTSQVDKMTAKLMEFQRSRTSLSQPPPPSQSSTR